jgi:hypothetical protein
MAIQYRLPYRNIVNKSVRLFFTYFINQYTNVYKIFTHYTDHISLILVHLETG